jgi:hypothetical protein
MTPRGLDRFRSVDPAEAQRKGSQPPQRGFEESHRPRKRSALDMVVCGSELDHPLQKLLEIRLRRKPELFPRFMRFPELASVEMSNPFAKPLLEIHGRTSCLSAPSRLRVKSSFFVQREDPHPRECSTWIRSPITDHQSPSASFSPLFPSALSAIPCAFPSKRSRLIVNEMRDAFACEKTVQNL